MCLETRFQITQCVQWIRQNSYQRLALQFSPQDLPESPLVCAKLREQVPEDIELYIVLTASCGVDFLAPLRLGTGYIEAIVAFGSNCDSPCLAADTPMSDLPVLFVFGERWEPDTYDYVKTQLQKRESEEGIVFYDLRFAALIKKLVDDRVISIGKVAKVVNSSSKWTFSQNICSIASDVTADNIVGHFSSPELVSTAKAVTWIGSCDNLFFRTIGCNIDCIDPISRNGWTIFFHKELTKRLAVIEKAKAAKTVGVVFTNTLPSVDATLIRVKELLKKKGKNSVLISIIQSADNTKFGNFGEVDVFALSSACSCGSLILTVKAHVPLISLTELEIALGVKQKFGGMEWNTEADDQEDEDVDGSASAPEKEIKDLLEYKDNVRSNWFGLQVAAGEDSVAEAEDGLSGLASAYHKELS